MDYLNNRKRMIKNLGYYDSLGPVYDGGKLSQEDRRLAGKLLRDYKSDEFKKSRAFLRSLIDRQAKLASAVQADKVNRPMTAWQDLVSQATKDLREEKGKTGKDFKIYLPEIIERAKELRNPEGASSALPASPAMAEAAKSLTKAQLDLVSSLPSGLTQKQFNKEVANAISGKGAVKKREAAYEYYKSAVGSSLYGGYCGYGYDDDLYGSALSEKRRVANAISRMMAKSKNKRDGLNQLERCLALSDKLFKQGLTLAEKTAPRRRKGKDEPRFEVPDALKTYVAFQKEYKGQQPHKAQKGKTLTAQQREENKSHKALAYEEYKKQLEGSSLMDYYGSSLMDFYG